MYHKMGYLKGMLATLVIATLVQRSKKPPEI